MRLLLLFVIGYMDCQTSFLGIIRKFMLTVSFLTLNSLSVCCFTLTCSLSCVVNNFFFFDLVKSVLPYVLLCLTLPFATSVVCSSLASYDVTDRVKRKNHLEKLMLSFLLLPCSSSLIYMLTGLTREEKAGITSPLNA